MHSVRLSSSIFPSVTRLGFGVIFFTVFHTLFFLDRLLLALLVVVPRDTAFVDWSHCSQFPLVICVNSSPNIALSLSNTFPAFLKRFNP